MKKNTKYRLSFMDLYYLLVFSLFFLFFFKELIFSDFTFHYRDICRYYYPTRFFAAECIHRGIFPFWNPYIFCGMPFFATMQPAVLHPLSIFCYLFKFSIAFKYFYLFNFFLGGIGIYLLLRSFALSEKGSLCGSIVFVFSGYLISIINLLTTLNAIVFWPITLLIFKKTLQSKKVQWSILLGVILSLEVFSGQPEILYKNILFLFLYLIFWAFWQYREKRLDKGQVMTVLKCLLISILCCGILVSIQLLPFTELITNSTRQGGFSYKHVTSNSFHPLEAITMVLPTFSWNYVEKSYSEEDFWFRQPWLRHLYFGIIVLMGILFSKKFRSRLWGYFFALAILGILLAYGKYTPVYKIFYNFIPGFHFFHFPVKFTSLLHLAIVVLSAFGLEYIINITDKKEAQKILKVGLIILAMLSWGLVWLSLKPSLLFNFFINNFLFNIPSTQLDVLYSKYLPSLQNDFLKNILFLSIFIIMMGLYLNRYLKIKIYQWGLVIVLFLSIVHFTREAEPLVTINFYRAKTPLINFLEKNLGLKRILLSPKSNRRLFPENENYPEADSQFLKFKTPLLSNLGLPYHFFDIEGYESINLADLYNLMSAVKTQRSPSQTRILDLLGLKYLFSSWELKDTNYENVGQYHFIKLYQNLSVLPRTFFVPQTYLVDNRSEAFQYLFSKEFDPQKAVVIEKQYFAQPVNVMVRDMTKPEVKIARYDANKIEIETYLPQAGWIILTDTYYPGWQIKVDGKREKIYRVDYLLRGVYLGAGSHKLCYFYVPTFWILGATCSLGLIMILSYIFTQQIKRIFNSC